MSFQSFYITFLYFIHLKYFSFKKKGRIHCFLRNMPVPCQMYDIIFPLVPLIYSVWIYQFFLTPFLNLHWHSVYFLKPFLLESCIYFCVCLTRTLSCKVLSFEPIRRVVGDSHGITNSLLPLNLTTHQCI